MQVKIGESKIDGKVKVPSSKSYAHRILIASFLSGERTELFGDFSVGDIETTADCLKCLGAKLELTDNHIVIDGNTQKNDVTLNVKDSGSTFRFLLPLVSALGVKVNFIGTNRLANRPIAKLLTTLTANGGRFSATQLPLQSYGELKGGDYVIDGNESSQYITGLLLALPILKQDSNIIINGKTVSSNYIDITIDVLKQFSISVKKTENGYHIDGGQRYVSPKTVYVEGDYSSASFFAVLGAINGKVAIENLNKQSMQGDKIFVDVLKRTGASVSFDGKLSVTKSKLKAFEFDAENYPDLVPILSVLAAFADGKTTIHNVSRLKAKESDRLNGVIELLATFSIRAELCDNSLYIYGGVPSPAVYNSPDDHRMAMSASILATSLSAISVISGCECVKKSYERFFEQLKQIGGNVDVQPI